MSINNFEIILRIACSLFLAFIIAGRYKLDDQCNQKSASWEHAHGNFGLFDHPIWLILAIAGLLIAGILHKQQSALLQLVQLLFDIFSVMMLSYCLLALLTPVLRKYFRPRTCSALWIIPCLAYALYYFLGDLKDYSPSSPRMIVIRSELIFRLIAIWLFVAILLFAWAVGSHLHFRNQLLKSARPVDELTFLHWTNLERQIEGEKSFIPLLISPTAVTPLSVGLTRKSMRVVLPDRYYSPEDLNLVLYHELLHITRRDTERKMFLIITRCIFWFNPLVWLAMKQYAEDTELAVDEMVLTNEPPETRSRYAELILGSAGDARGFSTCLSARASSLRYRLHAVVESTPKHSGYWLIGILVFIMCMCYGQITLTISIPKKESVWSAAQMPAPTSENLHCLDLMMDNSDITVYPDHIDENQNADSTDQTVWTSDRSQAVVDYILSLPCVHSAVSTDFSFNPHLYIFYTAEQTDYLIELTDNTLVLETSDGENYQTSAEYMLTENVDWDYVESLFEGVPVETFAEESEVNTIG